MSKSIDYHQGYIDALEYMKNSGLNTKSINSLQELHEEKISDILDDMYEDHKKDMNEYRKRK